MRQRILKVGFGVVFGIFWAFLISEIGLRYLVAQGTLPSHAPADIFAAAPVGWALEPSSHFRIFSLNGIISIETNHDGYRDRDYPPYPAADKRRIVVLGDSFTLSVETPAEQTFHTLLETAHADSLEVVSLGVSGYEIGQATLTYREIGRTYHPDEVWYFLYVGNDFNVNGPASNLPAYRLDETGALVLDNFPYEGKFELPLLTSQRSTPLMRASRVAFLIGTVLRRPAVPSESGDPAYCDYWTRISFPQPTPEQWALSQAVLLDLNQQVSADGATLRVMIIPTEMQVEDAQREALAALCPLLDDTPVQVQLTQFLDAHNIAYLDLLPALRDHPTNTDTDLYFPDIDIHWTPAGHQAVADIISGVLETP